MIGWKRRSKIEETPVATHTIRESKDGLYRVVKWESGLGGQKAYPVRFYAMVTVPRERIIGEHRTEAAAIRTVEQYERKIAG